MYANLLGDYIKGKDLSSYSEIVQKGITLHRTIDNLVDHHPAVIDLLHILYPQLPKISGIAVDLYFDHLLAKNWNAFHNSNYRNFVNDFYAHQPTCKDEFTHDFSFMLNKMKEFDWLYHYQFIDGLKRASEGLSQRISFENNLHEATDVFIKNEAEITKAFDLYIKDAIPFFDNYFKKT